MAEIGINNDTLHILLSLKKTNLNGLFYGLQLNEQNY